jgi:putative DNA primase/helicase
MRAIAYTDIEPLPPEWLWEGRIPQNMLTVLAGDGGIGKGRLVANLVSRVTRGAPMPDGSPGPPMGSALLATQEDDPHLAMVHRLMAEGADLSHVYDMTADFMIPESLPSVREHIDEIGDVRLVVIDPLSAVSSIALTSSNVRVRRMIMNPLEHLARDKGIALLVIHHTVKSGRVAGTKGITDAARMVLKVSRATADDSIRLIQVEKSNIASEEVGDIAYKIMGEPPRVHFLASAPEAAPKAVSVKDQVLVILKAEDGPVPAHQLARLTGADYGTVRVALTRLKAEGSAHSPERGMWQARAA